MNQDGKYQNRGTIHGSRLSVYGYILKVPGLRENFCVDSSGLVLLRPWYPTDLKVQLQVYENLVTRFGLAVRR